MKCRVIYKQDGTVSVIHPAIKAKRPDETMAEFEARVFAKAMAGHIGIEHDDIDTANLPTGDRDKWRGAKGQGVWVDNMVITKAKRRVALEAELDAELAKPNGNPLLAMQLRHKLDKGDY